MKEIEISRSNTTPKSFFNTCKKLALAKGIDIEGYIEYDFWIDESQNTKHTVNNHQDWEIPQREAYKFLPYDFQIFLQDTYNCIIEFQFDSDNKGFGYCYIKEN